MARFTGLARPKPLFHVRCTACTYSRSMQYIAAVVAADKHSAKHGHGLTVTDSQTGLVIHEIDLPAIVREISGEPPY